MKKTVKEISKITGISIRTLRYYDEIGLLKPARVTQKPDIAFMMIRS